MPEKRKRATVMDGMAAYQKGVAEAKKLLGEGLDRESLLVTIRTTMETTKNPTSEERSFARGMEDAARSAPVNAPDHLPIPDSFNAAPKEFQGRATVKGNEPVVVDPNYDPKTASVRGFENGETLGRTPAGALATTPPGGTE